MTDPTHPPTHLPNHTPTHVWGSLHRFQILKQNRIILIGWSVIEFLLILGVPSGDEGQWIGVGVGVSVWGVPHANMHMHACTCMFNMINMDASMRVAICNFYTCACVHVHACTCMYTCVWTAPMPPDVPQSFVPSPRAVGRPKHQNSISPELIEIIWFCLKILYLWTVLNSYRL